MKHLTLILLLFLCGCGSNPADDYVYWDGDIVWEGYVDESPELLAMFNEVVQCVDEFYPSLLATTENPYLYIVEGFLYYSGSPELKAYGLCNRQTGIIYVSDLATKPYYKHEFIHWITNKGAEIHGTDLMQKCSSPHTRL
jgi:hypothetical protein